MTDMALRYESESRQQIENPTESDLERLLSELDGSLSSYASLTSSDGSYIQAGGGPDVFTVEIREMRQGGSFRHLKAAHGKMQNTRSVLSIGGANVEVDASELLTYSDMLQLFRYFLRERAPDPSFEWHDLTPMFTGN